jgi:hypothetical protein
LLLENAYLNLAVVKHYWLELLFKFVLEQIT